MFLIVSSFLVVKSLLERTMNSEMFQKKSRIDEELGSRTSLEKMLLVNTSSEISQRRPSLVSQAATNTSSEMSRRSLPTIYLDHEKANMARRTRKTRIEHFKL